MFGFTIRPDWDLNGATYSVWVGNKRVASYFASYAGALAWIGAQA